LNVSAPANNTDPVIVFGSETYFSFSIKSIEGSYTRSTLFAFLSFLNECFLEHDPQENLVFGIDLQGKNFTFYQTPNASTWTYNAALENKANLTLYVSTYLQKKKKKVV
jgi:hypothetical protein